jgi:hypothetical protein
MGFVTGIPNSVDAVASPLVLQFLRTFACFTKNYHFYLKYVPLFLNISTLKKKKKTPWSESASELYRPKDHRLSAKWLPTFADKGCHVVSVKDPYGRILGFLDRSRYFSIK